MTVARWALVPDDPAWPVRVFTDRTAALSAAKWCPGRVSLACDEDALAERCRGPVSAGRRP